MPYYMKAYVSRIIAYKVHSQLHGVVRAAIVNDNALNIPDRFLLDYTPQTAKYVLLNVVYWYDYRDH